MSDSNPKLGLSIALIVILGVVPAIVLLWVCIWLLFFYAGDRTCWCTRRKRKAPSPDIWGGTAGNDTNRRSQNYNANYDGPYSDRSTVEPGSASTSGQPRNSDSITPVPVASRADARGSVNSINSNSVMQISQEPKPFV